MAMPVLPPALIAQLSTLVAQYISGQKEQYYPTAVPLSDQQKAAMAGFFRPELLNAARLLVLSGKRVANPDFYPMLSSMGFTNLPDQSTMAAITFIDTVVAHMPFNNDLLFHELVHVEPRPLSEDHSVLRGRGTRRAHAAGFDQREQRPVQRESPLCHANHGERR